MNTDKQTQVTVLVTGVGAIIGQGIVQCLRDANRAVRIVGVDRNPECFGPLLCDAFCAKPDVDESETAYIRFWENLLAEESVDLVLPGIEEDMFFLSAHREVLSERTMLGLNTPALIDLARDKWRLAEVAGAMTIPASLSRNWDECVAKLGPAPLLLKPRQGSGSRGIVRLENETDFAYWAGRAEANFMVQKIVGTDEQEFTVGLFGLGEGRTVTPPILFRRRLSPAGNTQYAEVVNDEALAAVTQALAERLQPVGPTNFQFRKDNGRIYLLEINPRFSSSSSLRAAFGYNEGRMALEYYLDGKDPAPPEIRFGRAWRVAGDRVELD
jgi:carbamoyl-phosphate synthase large subunit